MNINSIIVNPVMAGKVCPYCSSSTQYIDSAEIYGRSYGMVYICRPCDAYVGVHRGTDDALGRLANRELREWKKAAHAHFDPLWRKKMSQGIEKNVARTSAYGWLSQQLGIDRDLTHIGMMDVEQCKAVVELCKKYL